MGAFHQGAERLENLARGQIDGCRKIRAPCEGADRWGHFTRGQKKWNTLPGSRYMGVFYQGEERLEHLARGQIDGGISPGGRKIGASCQGADRWVQED